jgi:GNAT superfamily N-acetyltransferase
MRRIRQARPEDSRFVAHAIRAANAGGNALGGSFYEIAFGLAAPELEAVLSEALCMDGAGSALDIGSFLLVEDNGEPVATCAAWVEGEGGAPSSFVEATVLARALGASRWTKGLAALKVLSQTHPERTKASLQLESIYVVEQRRGHGMLTELFREAERARGAVSTAEICLVATNVRARRAYEKLGYAESRSSSPEPALVPLVGGDSFIVLARSLRHG